MDCREIRELLEEYALETLGEEQRQQVAEHIESCPTCRSALAEMSDVLSAFPSALAQASPHVLPASLKGELMQKLMVPPARPLPKDVPVSSLGNGQLVGSIQGEPKPMRKLGNRLRLALAAATLLCVLALVWGIWLNVVLARERALRAEYSNLVDQQEIVLEVIDSNETTKRFLRATQADSTAYGKLFTRAGMPHVVAMAARLVSPPPGQAYHLWVMLDHETKLAGIMQVNAEGFGLLVYDEVMDDPMYEAAQLTLQPIGSRAPETPAVIQWQAAE